MSALRAVFVNQAVLKTRGFYGLTHDKNVALSAIGGKVIWCMCVA